MGKSEYKAQKNLDRKLMLFTVVTCGYGPMHLTEPFTVPNACFMSIAGYILWDVGMQVERSMNIA